MERAIEFGAERDYAGGRFWLNIARELREGAVHQAALQMPGKATWNAEQAIRQPVVDQTMMMPSADQTVTMPAAPAHIDLGELCANCGYAIQLAGDMIVHSRTGQNVCPVPVDAAGTHTFATPMIKGGR
jgi:hypothetical protein